MTDPKSRSRRLLLVIATLFFAPLVLATLLYYDFPEWQPKGKVNHGVLIDPARPLPSLDLLDASGAHKDETVFRGRWSYLYLAGADCAQACRDKLFQIRQIRTLLNEKRQRVQRVYLAPDAAALASAQVALAAEHPDLRWFALTPGASATLRGLFGTQDSDALYLVDPNGNYLMVYPAAADSPGILKDIQRLLRLSQIG
jgi:cytochrome oxidase Cu insertion factor (SCO1/SenC/PrrC family)